MQGRSMLPKEPLLRKSNVPAGATIELVDVQGQPFARAYHITTSTGGFDLKTAIDSSRTAQISMGYARAGL